MPLVRPASGFRPLVARGFEALEKHAPAVGPVEPLSQKLETLLDLVVEWNARVDLTAARDPAELVDLFLADAVVLASASSTAAGQTWVDVGTGAGAPGLVLALLRPDVSVTLVEPKTKRVAFLRLSSERLGLRNVAVLRKRAEELGDAGSDIAVSRATFVPDEWLEIGTRLARRAVWVLLAKHEPPAAPGWQAVEDVAYRWPLTDAERRAVRYEPA